MLSEGKRVQKTVAVTFNDSSYLKDLLVCLKLHFLLHLVGGLVVLLMPRHTGAEKSLGGRCRFVVE